MFDEEIRKFVYYAIILFFIFSLLCIQNKTNIFPAIGQFIDIYAEIYTYIFVYVPNTRQILGTSFTIKYGKFYSSEDDKKDHYRRIQSWQTKNIRPFGKFPVNLNYMHLFPNPAYFQGNVESCYAFAAIGLLEAVLYKYPLLNGGQHIQLSVQEILDRSFSYGNNGEKGGHTVSAFEYIALMGVHKADRYKYRYGNCILDYVREICSIGSDEPKQSIHEYHCLPSWASDEELMTALVMYGPLCVAIYSDWQGFKSYDGTKVITKEYAPSGKPDHAVILVGWEYDPQSQQHYWIIRNSYGPDWGDNGYALIQRGGNVLGINDHVSFITLDGHLDDLTRKVEPMEVDELKIPNFSQSIRYLVN